MKRNKIIAAAVVVMMMVGALALMSCSNCPGEGDCKISATDPLGSIASWCFTFDFNDETGEKFEKDAKACFGDIPETATSAECQC